MKKLQMKDLTPAMLSEVKGLDTPEEVAAFFAARGYEVSEKGAQKILDYLRKQAYELDDSELDKVAGGCNVSGGSTT